MARDDWATLQRADGRALIVRKDAVVAFGPSREESVTLIWLAGRKSDDYVQINESEEDVARALGAA